METNNYAVMYNAVNNGTRAQAGVMIWIHKSIKNTIINYIYWIETKIEVQLNMGRGKLFLNSTPQKKKELRKRKFYNQSKEILNKTNKTDYILLSGDLYASIRNAAILNAVEIL